jgi:hypothetical protein
VIAQISTDHIENSCKKKTMTSALEKARQVVGDAQHEFSEEEIFLLLQVLMMDPDMHETIVPLLYDLHHDIYRTQMSPEYAAAFDLLRYGYVVVPMLSTEETQLWRERMLNAISTFPEYKSTARLPVLGDLQH